MLTAAELLSEPVVVPDIFVSGLSHLEDMGDGNWRLVMYSRQKSPYGGEDFVVVAKLVAPTRAILDGVRTALMALGCKCCGAMAKRVAH